MMTDARQLIEKISITEKQIRSREFFAPFTETSKRVYVKVDGINYAFRIVGQHGSGFGIFRPIDFSCAKYISGASIDITRNYLDALPKLHFILAYETNKGWVGYPFNLESAQKTIGLNSQAIIDNVSDVQRFDVITGRFDGMHFWFDEIFHGSDPLKADRMRVCFESYPNSVKLMRKHCELIKSITPEEIQTFNLAVDSWVIFQATSTEDILAGSLARGGGKFRSYVIRGDNIEVKWTSERGSDYTSLVKKESFDIVSAGICLEGEDHKFNLKDLPGVIREGEQSDLIYRTNRR